MENFIFKRKAFASLEEWKKNSNGATAALLEGPRRVGKSTIVEEFARREYRSYIKVDFANVPAEVLEVFSSISRLDDFFLRLQAVTGVVLYVRRSVIIFDEIQLQPKVRQAIKYLVKDGRYDYIETGSLLSIKKNIKGIVIPSEEWRIPVYPMDYEEFLWAAGKETYTLLEKIFTESRAVGQEVNRALMRDYRLYMAVGGMPQAVEAYIEGLSFQEIDRIKRRIIDLYEADFFRIDPSGRISMMFESIPAQLARQSKRYFAGLALNRRAGTKDFELLSDLINSRTVIPCFNCSDPSAVLAQGKELDRFKLYAADTGLFTTLILKSGYAESSVLYSKMLSDKLPANLGYLYENVAAQAIVSRYHELYYMSWQKENSTHSYEVDFLIQKSKKVMPVEVKSSRTDSHKSLDAFVAKFSSVATAPCVLSQKDLGGEGAVRFLPFYLASFL